MPDDLKNVLDDIESTEKETAELQAKISRLTQLVNKQKRIINEQEQLIEEQKAASDQKLDVPADVVELKEIIGAQRAQLKEKNMELEHLKGTKAQLEKEIELMSQQTKPLEEKYNQSFEKIGELKAEVAEQRSKILAKDDRIKNLEIKVQELKSFSDKLKSDYQKEIEEIREEHKKEKEELQSELNQIESALLDSKLTSTEKSSEAKDFATRFQEVRDKYDSVVSRVEELRDELREKEAEINKYEERTEDLRNFKNDNIDKIIQYDRLTELMEEEPLFKAFLIIKDIGGKGIYVDDLKSSLGVPIVVAKKHAQKLKDKGLVKEKDDGKLVVAPATQESDEE
ncbi:MAG: hypothetical protein BAJALOKI3v1_410029 [Promethearchaeota archaeon]|jgi:chromosome segregation ATPase|nr:MAG: hypothetical protein BAJALOKI3v1_410029 [Candidatus Lokiarchaeota archaeon]